MKRLFYFILTASLVFQITVKSYCESNTIQLSLDSAVELAKKNASQVKLKARELNRAKLELKKAKSKILPRIELQTASSYMTNPPEGVTIHKGELGSAPSPNSQFPMPFPDRDYVLIENAKHTYFQITTKMTQPIFTWNKIKNAIEIASIEAEIKSDELKREILETIYSTKIAYLSAILAKESLKELEETEKILIEINRDKEESFKQGLVTREDLLKSRTSTASVEMQIVQARENYRTSLETLKLLTDIDEEIDLELISDMETKEIKLDEETLKEMAASRSPDILIARKRLKEALKNKSISRAKQIFTPDFSLIVTLDIKGQQIPIVGSNWTMDWDKNLIISIGTSFKIFDAGESGLDTQESEENIRIAEEGLKSYRRLLSMNLRRAVQEARVSFYTMLSKKAELAEAEETVKNAKVSYENELITREKYGLARINLYSKKMEYLLSQFNYNKAIAQIEKLTGMEIH